MCYIFAACCIGVCSALQGPPNALQLAAYICITCDPVKLIPGGPGPLNQNLPWVRAGWRDTAFHFQDWQSLGKSKFFGFKSQLHPCWTCLSLDKLLSFSEFPSSSIRAGTTLWACKGFSSLVLWTFWAGSLFPVKDCLVHQRVSGSIHDSPHTGCCSTPRGVTVKTVSRHCPVFRRDAKLSLLKTWWANIMIKWDNVCNMCK